MLSHYRFDLWGWLNPQCVRLLCIRVFMQRRLRLVNLDYFPEDSSVHYRLQALHYGKEAVLGQLVEPSSLDSPAQPRLRRAADWVAGDPRSRRWGQAIIAVSWISFNFEWGCQSYLKEHKISCPAIKECYCSCTGSQASTCHCLLGIYRAIWRNRGSLSCWWEWLKRAEGGIWIKGWMISLGSRRILEALPTVQTGSAIRWREPYCRNLATGPKVRIYSQPISSSTIILFPYQHILRQWYLSLKQL